MKNSAKKLSIIICTHNRADILRECLQSLLKQTTSFSRFEVLIVNNNSTDHTEKVVEEFLGQHPIFRLVKETQTGLSYARNSGYLEATSDWVAYIDDDALAHENFVERALETINKYDFECIGGAYLPWFKYGKAKWLPQEMISNVVGRAPNFSVKEITNQNACGMVVMFKKNELHEIGGFPTHLGMIGDKIAYGEEDAVQIALRKKGYKVGLDEGLRVDHLVAKYKLDWRWHIKAAYGHGFAGADENVFGINLKYPKLFLLTSMIIKPILKIPSVLKKLASNKNYFWQNAMIDVAGSIFYSKGQYDKFQEKRRNKAI